MVEQREIDIGTIIFSEESHIYLRGFMNKQNFRKWSRTKPEEVYEKPLHSPKVTVWCCLSSNKKSTGHISLKILKEMHRWLQQTHRNAENDVC